MHANNFCNSTHARMPCTGMRSRHALFASAWAINRARTAACNSARLVVKYPARKFDPVTPLPLPLPSDRVRPPPAMQTADATAANTPLLDYPLRVGEEEEGQRRDVSPLRSIRSNARFLTDNSPFRLLSFFFSFFFFFFFSRASGGDCPAIPDRRRAFRAF